MAENRPTLRATPGGKILLVDDDGELRHALARLLQSSRHEVTQASDGAGALDKVAAPGAFDVIVSDVHMPGMTGIELLRGIRAYDLDVPVLLMTGLPSVETAAQAVRHGAIEYLVKPVDPNELDRAVTRAIRLSRIARVKRELLAHAKGTQAVGDRAGLEAAFEDALRTMWMAFQPILARDGTRYGHEALLRTKSATLPHPGAVIDAAEKLGRLPAIGRRVRALSSVPIAADPACGALFVNLHPEDLFDDELTSADSPLTAIAHRVVLEITERASIDQFDNLRSRVAELRNAGFRIAIDDLGAGYAGLSALALLEPEVIKLDISLIHEIESSKTKQRLVGSLTSASKDLGMLVLAEGVETRAELDTVLELGCDLVQGYLIARPGPAFPTANWPLTT